jgi:hypothetical protein
MSGGCVKLAESAIALAKSRFRQFTFKTKSHGDRAMAFIINTINVIVVTKVVAMRSGKNTEN